MSSKAKSSKTQAQDKKAAQAKVPHNEPSRSGRSRFGPQIRFGRDKKWHFSSQQPDEVVNRIVREHWGVLVKSALPLLGALILLIIIALASVKVANPNWPILELIAVVIIAGTLLWFIRKDFIKWYSHTYIITNKRIFHSSGVFEPKRETIPLEKVMQVGIDLNTFWGFILRYGTVLVYLYGGDFVMKNIPRPRKLKDEIDAIRESIKASKPKAVKPPRPDHPEVAAIIDGLAEAKEPPKLENADEQAEKQYMLRHPHGRLGPRRTFGGILRIPCEVRYTSGEYTVKYIQRSRYILYRQITIPILLLLGTLVLAVFAPSTSASFTSSHLTQWWIGTGLFGILLLLIIGALYLNYADDVYILSNKRIIDIHRRFIFLEDREELEYKNIKDIKVKIPNVVQHFIDIGDVSIGVAGSPAPAIRLITIDHPESIMEKINEIKSYGTKAEEIKKENERKAELHTWFGHVITGLVDNTQVNKGAPNLENMDLIGAMEEASEQGFQVTVVGEEPSKPGIPPGRVIHQNPPPGTVIQPGGKIQIVLSRKASTSELMDYY
jgi:membrane protein YdbS with pleckstrin-like domain